MSLVLLRPMTRTLSTLALLILLAAGAARGEVPILPFDQVEAGMRGTGRTVFQGTRIETFEVEVLGKLANIGPDQDLILARCSGGPLAETGVLAGMSGSPVTVDGKLIGAVAYSWGFAKEAIAGITPIEEMLAIAALDRRSPGLRSSASLPPGEELLRPLAEPQRLESFFLEVAADRLRRPAGALPVAVPLSVAGLGGAGLGAVESFLGDAGFLPLQAGAAGREPGTGPPLEPGSAIGLQLVRGDLEMTATGTVTWVDGDRVLGFGHPLFGLGSVDLPMTGAEVQTLLPSLMRSARIATPLAEIGALRQDRSSGVFGQISARPRMIPVRFQLGDPERGEQVYSFDIADDPLLAPLLLYVSLNGILTSRERPLGGATVRLKEGSVIKMADGEDVELDNLFAGNDAFDYGTGIAAYILYLLMNNTWSQPQIAGVNLILEYEGFPRSGTIRRAALERYLARPGETLRVSVILAPYRGADRVYSTEIKIPDDVPPGELTLRVGSAAAMAREEFADEPVLPRDLDQLIRLINRLRRNDRIHVSATRKDNGILLHGSRLPNLPPSASTVLSRPESKGIYVSVPLRSVLEETIPTDFAVQGSARIRLEVEAP
jgi:hypothetical protein